MEGSQYIQVNLILNNKILPLTIVNIDHTVYELDSKIIKVLKCTYTNKKFVENYCFLDKNLKPTIIKIKEYYDIISTKIDIIHSKNINNINCNVIYIKLLEKLYFQKNDYKGDVNVLFINNKDNFSKIISVYSSDNFSILYSKIHNYLNYNSFYLKTNEDICFCDINKQKLDINFLDESINDYIYETKNKKKYIFITKSNIYKFK